MSKNIIIIIIDALREKNLGCYGYNKNTSPNIDKLSKESLLLNNAFSVTNATDPSLTSILTGTYPSNHGILNHGEKVTDEMVDDFFNKKNETLQEILKENGYHTCAIDYLDRWHKIGFDEYLSQENKNLVNKLHDVSPTFLKKIEKKIHEKIFEKKDNKKYHKDKKYTQIALEKINEFKNNNNPFFMFLHYWGVHIPYEPPSDLLDKFLDHEYKAEISKKDIFSEISGEWEGRLKNFFEDVDSTEEMLARYDACIRFIDGEVNKIINQLKEEEMFDDTIIIITSDHGESLLEHGIYFDHHGLYEESIRVPLIIKSDEIKNKELDEFVQHTDLMPTLLDILDIKYEKEIMDGSSIMPLVKKNKKIRDAIFVEENYTQSKKAIRTDRYKYIKSESEEKATCRYCGTIHGGIEELYDLKKDPKEEKNILEEKPKLANELEKLLQIKYSKITKKSKMKNTIKTLNTENKI